MFFRKTIINVQPAHHYNCFNIHKYIERNTVMYGNATIMALNIIMYMCLQCFAAINNKHSKDIIQINLKQLIFCNHTSTCRVYPLIRYREI